MKIFVQIVGCWMCFAWCLCSIIMSGLCGQQIVWYSESITHCTNTRKVRHQCSWSCHTSIHNRILDTWTSSKIKSWEDIDLIQWFFVLFRNSSIHYYQNLFPINLSCMFWVVFELKLWKNVAKHNKTLLVFFCIFLLASLWIKIISFFRCLSLKSVLTQIFLFKIFPTVSFPPKTM